MGDTVKTNSDNTTSANKSSRRGAKQAMQANEFTIYVMSWTSKISELQVMDSYSIDHIKEMMSSTEKTPKGQQILIFKAQELEDHRTLEHYGIKNGSWLDQRVKRYVLDITH